MNPGRQCLHQAVGWSTTVAWLARVAGVGLALAGLWAMEPTSTGIGGAAACLVAGWWMVSLSTQRIDLFPTALAYWDGFSSHRVPRDGITAGSAGDVLHAPGGMSIGLRVIPKAGREQVLAWIAAGADQGERD